VASFGGSMNLTKMAAPSPAPSVVASPAQAGGASGLADWQLAQMHDASSGSGGGGGGLGGEGGWRGLGMLSVVLAMLGALAGAPGLIGIVGPAAPHGMLSGVSLGGGSGAAWSAGW
jgi:hypothetical protein